MLRVYENSLNVVRLVRSSVGLIGRQDPDLANQLKRAVSSVVLNIAEGSYSRGRNREKHYAIALGSAKETKACLEVAQAFEYIGSVDTQIERELHSICAVLYRLSR